MVHNETRVALPREQLLLIIIKRAKLYTAGQKFKTIGWKYMK